MSLHTVARKIKDETGKTPKLICDFLNIFFWLMSEFHEAKVKCKDYQTYSCLYGGDLNEYADRFIAFVRALRRVGVDPIFSSMEREGLIWRGSWRNSKLIESDMTVG